MKKMEIQKRKIKNNVKGILLLDKPIGISSNRLLQIVKRIYNAKKAGHTGSLDVPASGLLPICFGEATKVSGYLLNSNKTKLIEIFVLNGRSSMLSLSIFLEHLCKTTPIFKSDWNGRYFLFASLFLSLCLFGP